MIDRQDEFKEERRKALKSGDIEKIRAYAKKYRVKLPADDEAILKMARNAPDWD